MKRFGNAAKAAAKRQRGAGEMAPIKAGILDRDIEFQFPGSGAVAYLSMIAASADTDLEAGAGLLNFLISMVDEDDQRYIQRVILNPRSGFDLDDVPEVIEYLIEQWGAERPTTPASDSSASQASTGTRSTGATRRAGSTRSTSRSTASSTPSITSSSPN
jgi:hypothetical protein